MDWAKKRLAGAARAQPLERSMIAESLETYVREKGSDDYTP